MYGDLGVRYHTSMKFHNLNWSLTQTANVTRSSNASRPGRHRHLCGVFTKLLRFASIATWYLLPFLLKVLERAFSVSDVKVIILAHCCYGADLW